MKEHIKTIRLSPVALSAIGSATARIRATASAASIPIARLTRLNLNHCAHPWCLNRGEQGMRLIGTGTHPLASSQRVHPSARI
ncbi:hypothetical protein AYM40_06070 [Paraburkholderia phytofirmans OLGA172]|uniref:Uncharacterized protein n=1 Tax=Paraburkholderia phytofirmans OLGA172 TaxID=1417228 RepID=A0A160FIN8_9BURK|nr:hypothetical protein AYM40_06070 [Paraburkholderia phytofirmans OLGA172]